MALVFSPRTESATPPGKSGGLSFSSRDRSFIKEEEDISQGESALTGVLKGLLPSAATVAAATTAAEMAAPSLNPWVIGGSALVAGGAAALGTSALQEAALETVAPETAERARQAEKAHPTTSFVSSLLSFSPFTGVGTKGLKALAAAETSPGKTLGMGKAVAGTSALGGGIETGREVVSGEDMDYTKIGVSALAAPLMLGNTKLGKAIAPSLKKKPLEFSKPEETSTLDTDQVVTQWKQPSEVKPREVVDKTTGEITPVQTELDFSAPSEFKLTEGKILNEDGSQATLPSGKPATARRIKETGEILYDPEAIKASWESSGPTDRPWIKERTSSPEEYQRFIIEHEKEHATTLQKEGESTLDYEKRVNENTWKRIESEPPIEVKAPIPDVREIGNIEDFHATGRRIMAEHGEEAARKFSNDYIGYNKDLKLEVPKSSSRTELADILYQADTKVKADDVRLRNLLDEHSVNMHPDEVKGMLHDWVKSDDTGFKLSPESQALKDKYIGGMKEEAQALAKRLGIPLTENYQPRILLREEATAADKLKRLGEDLTRQEGAFADKIIDKTPDVAKERGMFVVERPNGERIVIQTQDNGTFIWEKGIKKGVSRTSNVKPGDTIYKGIVKEATIAELEQHSPYRYSKNAILNWGTRLNELRSEVRNKEFLREFADSDSFKSIGMDVIDKETGKPASLPAGWRTLKETSKIPELAGKAFDPKIAAVLDDWSKSYEKNWFTNLNSMLIKNMMLNPIPHMFNEVMHLFNMRGATGWFTPGGLIKFGRSAKLGVQDVLSQSKLYQEVLREGGSLLSADVRNKEFFRVLMEKGAREAFNNPAVKKQVDTIAVKMGMTPIELYNKWSKTSNKYMWVTRDMMYMQSLREVMAKKPDFTVKQAITYVERHMPNYRLPSEIAGSRKLSEVLGNPNVAVFSRYHYGMVRSVLNTIKDVNPKNLRTAEGRESFKHGADTLAAVAIAYGVLYPLMDEVETEVIGLESEQRRAGPYHLLHAGVEVYEGKKDTQALLAPVFTFNPLLLLSGQLVFNRELYSGKQVYHPTDSAELIAEDLKKYAIRGIPQGGPMTQAAEGGEGLTKTLAKQLDIKSKTWEQEKKQRANERFIERDRRRREREYNRSH